MTCEDYPCSIIDTPEGIVAFRLLAMYHALSLEIKTGMRMGRGANVPALIRNEIGSTTRSKAKLLDEFGDWLIERGIMQA